MRGLVLGVLLGSPLMIACATYHDKPIHAPELETAYRARTLDDAQLRSFVEVGVGTALATWPPRALDLKTLTFIGYYYSADLEVARAQLAVAEAGIRAAGARANPELTGNVGYNRNPESHVEYGLIPAFTFETAGKRGYRILRAERQADAARIGLSEAGWTLRSRIRAAFVNHLVATQRLDVLQSEQGIRGEIVEIFDRRLPCRSHHHGRRRTGRHGGRRSDARGPCECGRRSAGCAARRAGRAADIRGPAG
jgi:outer membrane protein TolC